jgi:hypothetical protein
LNNGFSADTYRFGLSDVCFIGSILGIRGSIPFADCICPGSIEKLEMKNMITKDICIFFNIPMLTISPLSKPSK